MTLEALPEDEANATRRDALRRLFALAAATGGALPVLVACGASGGSKDPLPLLPQPPTPSPSPSPLPPSPSPSP
jgi:hypothetical protein